VGAFDVDFKSDVAARSRATLGSAAFSVTGKQLWGLSNLGNTKSTEVFRESVESIVERPKFTRFVRFGKRLQCVLVFVFSDLGGFLFANVVSFAHECRVFGSGEEFE
jgi:hypothetical protein